jgi:hypothetical protein
MFITVTIEEYKEFICSLGLKVFGLDFPVAPKCLVIKAELVKKYYKTWWLYEHREITQVLSILTPETLIIIILGYPAADTASIAVSPIISLEYHNGYPLFKCSDNSEYIECTLEGVQKECDRLLA